MKNCRYSLSLFQKSFLFPVKLLVPNHIQLFNAFFAWDCKKIVYHEIDHERKRIYDICIFRCNVLVIVRQLGYYES